MSGINWSILAYAGVFLIGLGVIIIAIAIFMTLSKIRRTLALAEEIGREITTIADDAVKLAADLNGTVKKVERNLEPIMHESNLLLQNTNVLAEDIQEKSRKLNPVFDSTDSIVTTIKSLNQAITSMKNNASSLIDTTNVKIVDLKSKADDRLAGLKGNIDKFKQTVKKDDTLEVTVDGEVKEDKLAKLVSKSKKGVEKASELIKKVVNKENNIATLEEDKEDKLTKFVTKSKDSVEKAGQLLNKFLKK